MPVEIRQATVDDARQLNKLVLAGLDDKKSEVYRENVEKFGIPEEYVRKAFSIEALTAAVKDKKQLFLVAVEGGKLIGFAQTIRDDKWAAELDRIFLIPECTGKGTGTRLLNETVNVLASEGISKLTVKAGKNETLARRFYEKNGFKLVREVNVQAPWGRELNLALYELEIAS